MDWQAIGLSLRLSACTMLVLVVFGLPLAYWLANTRWRGKFIIEAIVALPIVLPPTVLGFYVLMLVRVELDAGFPLFAFITRPACEDLNLQPGEPVTALIKAPAVHLIGREP
jgi:molybdopterin-binding protein